MTTFFIRSEHDPENDRMHLGIYTTDCWEIKLCDLVKLGDCVAVHPYPHHILTIETSRLLRDIMAWAETFQREDTGVQAFLDLWSSMPLEHSVAKPVDFTNKATAALEETKVFLLELPSDLGRGSLNGMAVQLAVKVDEALR